MLDDSAVSGALRGKLLLQLSLGSPEQARRMAAWALERSIDYLGGAIILPAPMKEQSDGGAAHPMTIHFRS